MANKYWVGNGGNWSDTAHWSLSSGGAGGASEPVAGDTAVFDLNSGSYNFTVQIHSGTNAQCNFVISNTHVAFEVLGELSLSNNIEYLRGLTINGGTLTTNNYNIYVYDWIGFVFDYSAYLGSSTITFAGSLSFTEVEGFNYICSASSAKFVATLDNPAPMNGHYIDVQSDIELGEFSITANHTNTFYIIENTSFSKVTLTGSGTVTTSFNQPYTTTIRMPGGLTLIGEPQSSRLTLSNANFSMASGSCDAHNIIMLGCTASGGAIFNSFTSNGNIDGGGNDGWDFGVRYWVGNGGNWSNTDHWSHSSGGAGGVSVPTEDHNVYFDDNSFTLSNQTVLIDEDINVKTFDVSLYNESINGLTIDFNSKNVNCLELDIFSYSPIIIDLSNAFVNGEFTFGYNSLNAIDLLNITNCTFTVPMFNVFNMGEDYFPYQLNITSLNYIFTEDVLQINLNTDIDIYIENLNIINLTTYPPPEENWLTESNELYWTIDGQYGPEGGTTVTVKNFNFGWDVRQQDLVTDGAYSYTDYRDIPSSAPFGFTIENFVKDKSVLLLGAEYVVLQKVLADPQLNEYAVSESGEYTFNAGNAGGGVLLDYVFTEEPSGPDDARSIVFNFDTPYQFMYHLIVIRYDANLVLLDPTPPVTTKYWVGNGGNWSDTAHWSLSSGGSGGASVPTIEDSVIFDANSITIEDQTVIAYMYPNFYCNGLDFSNIAVSFTFSLSSQSLKIAGGILRLSSLLVLTFSYSSKSILFVADSCEFYCNGYTGRLQLGADFDSSAGTVKPSVVCYDSITSYDFRLLLDECDFTTDVIITSEICRIYCGELTVLNLLASDITCSESFQFVVYPTTAVNSSASITVGNSADFSCYNAELLEAPITLFNHLIFDPSVGVSTYAELSFYFDNSVYNSYAGKVYGNTIQVLPGFTNFYFNSYSNFSDVYLHLNDLSVCGSLEQQLSWEIEQSSRSITRILIDSGEINTEYTTLKGICASGAVPTGLSNVCVGGIASAFSTSSGYDPADAFDNVHDTDWEGVGLPNWLQYDLGAGASKTVERYMLIPWDQYRYCCTKWNFEGSNDGLSWNVLDSQDNTSSIGGFVIDNPVSYRFYRINIFEAGESGSPDLTEFRMFEGSEYKDGATFYALTSNGCIDGGGNTGWIFEIPPSNKSVFLRFNDINIAKGTRLLPESILLTLNLSSIITELTENTIKIYINEISNVISAPTTIEEFNALVLSEPILYQTNLQRKNLTSMHIDITELIKKVINLENWSSGNSIMLVLKNDDPLFLKFFDFSENADKVAMISKTDVTTTSNIETGIITSSNTVLVSEETRTVVIPSGYVIGDYVFIVGNHIIGKAPNPVPSADYYFIHNFETAVDQPDYVWDMAYPDDYELYYENTVLDPDAKFGNYACDVTNNSIVGMYYEPYDTTNEFWPPLTYEFWFNFTPIDGWGYVEIWLFGWKQKPEGGLTYAMYQTWCQVGKGYYVPHTPYSYMEDWIFDTYSELISEDQYPIPFAFSTYNHCAIVVLTDRIKLFINGTLHKEYVSTNPNGFDVMYSDFYIDNEKGSKLLVDALSITKGEKYTENFTPPTEPPGV